MRQYVRTLSVTAALCAAAAACAHTARAAAPILSIAWEPASSANYTRAGRPTWQIRKIVIHTTEGGFAGSVSWLRNPRSKASAHYVVSSTGRIAQLVRESDIAWHAGNYAINRESIGIEHEGFTYRSGTYTDAEYRASARLAGWIARRYLLPVDRSHFIGHADVPDPNNAKLKGGFAHHMDPGRYWDWGRYLAYVRTYARGGTPPVVEQPAVAKPRPITPTKTATVIRPGGKGPKVGPISLANAGFAAGQLVSGWVRWQAPLSGGAVKKVEYLVDGKLAFTAHKAPYAFGEGWDTTRISNGAHVLTVRVTSSKGAISGTSVRVRVTNTPFQVASASLQNGATVGGRVRWDAVASGAPVDHVDYLVDGRIAHTEQKSPYVFDAWDTTKETNGAHTLALRGVAEDGRVAESTLTVVVQNVVATPPPKQTPSSRVKINVTTLHDNQRLSGDVDWLVDINTEPVERVEFWVDGILRWTERTRPYRFNGDKGTWSTDAETAGWHVLTVRAFGGGSSDSRTFRVRTGATSAPPPAPTPAPAPVVTPFSVSVAAPADGATVNGQLQWNASVDGATPDRVEFAVDGRVRWTEKTAPFRFNGDDGSWDTTKETAGKHVLLVHAVAGTRTADATITVTVANTVPLLATSSVKDATTLKGAVSWAVVAQGPAVAKVEYRVDGALRHTETSSPYVWDWDTTKDPDGAHAVRATVYASDGRTLELGASIAIANTPAPVSSPSSLAIVSTTIADGDTLAGSVDWTVEVTGEVRKVELWIDGRRRGVVRSAPWTATWDTTREKDGDHTVRVVVVDRRGTTVEQTSRVTVKNSA